MPTNPWRLPFFYPLTLLRHTGKLYVDRPLVIRHVLILELPFVVVRASRLQDAAETAAPPVP